MLDIKTISVILVSTVLGGAIGFGMSYVFLNGEIQGLQLDLALLGVTVGQISDITTNMSLTILDVVETLSTGLKGVTEYASTRVSQLQTQLDALDSAITELNSTVHQTDGRRWHIAIDERSNRSIDDYVTDQFPLIGSRTQISWSMTGRSANASIIIQIRQSNGLPIHVLASSGYKNTFINELTLTEPGDYFLKISTNDVDLWSVIIRDYY